VPPRSISPRPVTACSARSARWPGREAATRWLPAGVEIELVELDVADDDSVRDGFAEILAAPAVVVDHLVNNAGVGGNAVAEECPPSSTPR
jgi:NAD(P)-dependent dehydrogenase (short-subunit alcohol dehydrogenase family)